ncbi:MAG: DUF3375 family protein [Desulfurivibrio sp.]|nr:DUF3375 family protein [Desulfurivibrio sp.]
MNDNQHQPTELDFATLERLRREHPAWRLLCSEHAPLVASFLHRVFIVPNVRVMSLPELAEALEDQLFVLREEQGQKAFPKSATAYLSDGPTTIRAGCVSSTPPAPMSPTLI